MLSAWSLRVKVNYIDEDYSASHGAFFFCTFLVQLCLVEFIQISVLIGYKNIEVLFKIRLMALSVEKNAALGFFVVLNKSWIAFEYGAVFLYTITPFCLSSF